MKGMAITTASIRMLLKLDPNQSLNPHIQGKFCAWITSKSNVLKFFYLMIFNQIQNYAIEMKYGMIC
jgi:hypothetical protein